MKTPYDDIIHLPHHVPRNHPQMSLRDRAAQFAPFAALTGCEAAVAAEVGRLLLGISFAKLLQTKENRKLKFILPMLYY